MRQIQIPNTSDGHAAPITHIAGSSDGRVSTSSYDGSVRIWSRGAAECLAELQHFRLVNASAWSPDGQFLATASADQTIGVWRVEAGGRSELVRCLARHTDDVNSVAWSLDGTRLVAVSEDHSVSLWNVASGEFLGTLARHSGHCMAVATSADGKICTVGEDGAVFVFGSADSQVAPVEAQFDCSIEGCAWSPDGSQLALACDDGVLRVLGPDLNELWSNAIAESAIRSVAFWDEETIVAGSYDASIRLVERGGKVAAMAKGGRMWPRSIDVVDDVVYVGSFGSRPAQFSLPDLTPIEDGGPATFGINALATTNSRIAIGLDSGQVLIADHSLGTEVICEVGTQPILSLAAADDAFYAGTYDGELLRLDADGVETGRVSGSSPITSLALSPSGDALAAGNYRGELAIYSPDSTLQPARNDTVHAGSIKSLSWLSDTTVVSGGTDDAVKATDVDTMRSSTLTTHGNLVNDVDTLHGSVVASGSRDRTVTVLRDNNHRYLLGADLSVKAVGLQPHDGAVVVLAGSYDFRLYRWELGDDDQAIFRNGEVVHEFNQAISRIATDQRTGDAIVASWDGTMIRVRPDGTVVGRARSIHDMLGTRP